MRIKKEKLICLTYGIMIFFYALLQTMLPGRSNIINQIIKFSIVICFIVGFLIKVLTIKKSNIKSLLLFSILGMLLIYNVIFNNSESYFLLIVAYTFILSDCNVEDILKSYFYGTIMAVILTIDLWVIGFLPNQESFGRNFLGFSFSTYGPNMFFQAITALVGYKKKNIKWVTFLIIEIINIFLWIKTQTLAIFILINALIVIYYLLRINKISKAILKNKILRFIINHFAVVMLIATLTLQIAYNFNYTTDIFEKMNRISSGRLEYGRRAFNNLEIKPFGQEITWIMDGENYFYLDSSYLHILFNNGYIMLILLVYLMDLIEKKGIVVNDIFIVIAISFVLIHAISDPQLLSFRYNPFFLIIIPLLKNERKENNEGTYKENLKQAPLV